MNDGKLLAEIYRSADVSDQQSDESEIHITARVGKNVVARLERAGASVSYSGNGERVATMSRRAERVTEEEA